MLTFTKLRSGGTIGNSAVSLAATAGPSSRRSKVAKEPRGLTCGDCCGEYQGRSPERLDVSAASALCRLLASWATMSDVNTRRLRRCMPSCCHVEEHIRMLQCWHLPDPLPATAGLGHETGSGPSKPAGCKSTNVQSTMSGTRDIAHASMMLNTIYWREIIHDRNWSP